MTVPRVRFDIFASAPARRAVERFYLGFTAVWGAILGTVMLSGAAVRWGDVELMILGVGLALATWIGPFVLAPKEDRPWYDSTPFKMALVVTGFAFGMNYLCTPFFFDVLHMHYGFTATITIENNPVFLYFTTVPYFATYCVLANIGARLIEGWLGVKRGGWFWISVAPVVVLLAFLETALNANPWMTSLFCFDDMAFMLWFGSLSYGVGLYCALPAWLQTDGQTPLWRVALYVAGGLALTVIGFALLRSIAPHFTTVVDGAVGLRDYAGSCLISP